MTDAARLVIDFEALLDELRRRGWSTRVIAERVQVSVSSVVDYRNGATPQFHVGERMVEAWCAATGNAREQVPRTKDFPSGSKIRSW